MLFRSREIAKTGALSVELGEKLRQAIEEFKVSFQPSDGGGPGPGHEGEVQPLTEEEMERLKRFRRPTEEEFDKKAGPSGRAEGSPGIPF